jgi:hypothetical protein
MSKREIAVLAVRIISIQLFLTSLSKFEEFLAMGIRVIDVIQKVGATTPLVPSAIGGTAAGGGRAMPSVTWSTYSTLGSIDQGNLWLMISANLLIVSLWFLIAGYLWFGAPHLSRSLVQEYAGDPPLNMHGLDVTRLAFSLLGVYMLTSIVPHLLGNIFTWVWHQVRWTVSSGTMIFANASFSWFDFIRLFVALWLTFGTRGLVGMIYKTRQWAQKSHAPKAPPVP